MTISFGFVHLKIITTLPNVSGQNIEVSHFPLKKVGSILLGSDYLHLDIKAVVLWKMEFNSSVWFFFYKIPPLRCLKTDKDFSLLVKSRIKTMQSHQKFLKENYLPALSGSCSDFFPGLHPHTILWLTQEISTVAQTKLSLQPTASYYTQRNFLTTGLHNQAGGSLHKTPVVDF